MTEFDEELELAEIASVFAALRRPVFNEPEPEPLPKARVVRASWWRRVLALFG